MWEGLLLLVYHTLYWQHAHYSFFHLVIIMFLSSLSHGSKFSRPCCGCRCPACFYHLPVTQSYEISHLTFEGNEQWHKKRDALNKWLSREKDWWSIGRWQVNVYTSWIKKLCFLRNSPIIHPAKVFIFPLQSRSPAIIYNFLADGNIYVRVCSVIKQQYVMPREMPAEDKHRSL